MIRQDAGDLDRAMQVLQSMEDAIDGRQFSIGGKRIVNQQLLMQHLQDLADCLPRALTQATALMTREKEILDKARRDAAEQQKKAQEEAQRIIDEAKRKADEMTASARNDNETAAKAKQEALNQAAAEKSRAEKEAAALRQQAQRELDAARSKAQSDVEAAQQQAQQVYQGILQKAQYDAANHMKQVEAAAAQAMSQENVYRMAVVKAQEMQDQATQAAAVLRQRSVEYVDGLLADADVYFRMLSEDIRKQRQALSERS